METSSIRTFAVAVLLVSAGCAQAQRPYRFVVRPKPDEAIDVVARSLAENGHAPALVDRHAGIVQTRWENTGFLYGQIQNVPATIVRRYTAVLAPLGDATVVTLRVDAQRCMQGAFALTDTQIEGPCEFMSGLVESHQEELDRLGAIVERALALADRPPSGPPAARSP